MAALGDFGLTAQSIIAVKYIFSTRLHPGQSLHFIEAFLALPSPTKQDIQGLITSIDAADPASDTKGPSYTYSEALHLQEIRTFAETQISQDTIGAIVGPSNTITNILGVTTFTSLAQAIGNNDISKMGASLSASLGTPTTGLLGTASTTVTAAIGETVIAQGTNNWASLSAAIGTQDISPIGTSVTDALNNLNTVIGGITTSVTPGNNFYICSVTGAGSPRVPGVDTLGITGVTSNDNVIDITMTQIKCSSFANLLQPIYATSPTGICTAITDSGDALQVCLGTVMVHTFDTI